MSEEYPYMLSNNKLPLIVDAIEKAAKPEKLTSETLKHWGFTSSNDRAVIPLFKRLGILDANATPTKYYDDIKDKSTRKTTFASRIRETYADLFSIDTNIHKAGDESIRSAFARVTGKDAPTVTRYLATFKALVAIADFEKSPLIAEVQAKASHAKDVESEIEDKVEREERPKSGPRSFHYNIQIHLPATTDISVYNAIFKALKEHLDV